MDEKTLLAKLNELIINTNNGNDSGTLQEIDIQSERKINDEYTLYFFDDGDFISWCPVLVSGEIIFTPYDWQLSYKDWVDCDEKELSDYISCTKWIDQEGIDGVMFDGMPRKIFDKV